MERLFSVAELADRLGLAKATIYKKTGAKTIPFVRVGRIRFREADIERWLNERSVEPASGGKSKRRIAEKGKTP